MSTTFVPPKPSQWEGADKTFKPPPVSSWEGPAGAPRSQPQDDVLQAYKTGVSPLEMLTNVVTAPITGLIHAPGQIYDYVMNHQPSLGTGGFMSEEPITDAYGNALAALGPESGPAIRTGGRGLVGGIKGGFNAIPSAKTTGPATAGALIGGLIKGQRGAAVGSALGAAPAVLEGFFNGARESMFPTPPEVAARTGPFKPNPAIARKIAFGGPPPDTFGPGKPITPTGWTPPTEPLYPTPKVEPPPEPTPFKRFTPNPALKARMKYTPSNTEPGMPSSRPVRVKGRTLRPPPTAAAEAGAEAEAGPVEINGTIITPAMREALVEAELAKRGLPSKMTPMPDTPPIATSRPTTAAPFQVKPGEGTHLGMEVKEGHVPAKADYQAAARNVWANHMALRMKALGKTVADVQKMSAAEVDAEAKALGINGSSAEKLQMLMKKMDGKP